MGKFRNGVGREREVRTEEDPMGKKPEDLLERGSNSENTEHIHVDNEGQASLQRIRFYHDETQTR